MIEYFTLEEVLLAHSIMIEKFGGLHGIRDNNLLISAIETPKASIGGQDLYPTVYDKAAAYLFHIVKNHPFNDANKRTGATIAYLFLKANDAQILFDDEAYEDFVVEVAAGSKTREDVANFLKHGQKTLTETH